MQQLKPRRSVLYMPGSNARALEKAKTLAIDSLIFDLEDAVAPDMKQQARKQIVQAVKAGGYEEREIIVRINGLDTEWGQDDIATIAELAINGVLLPKINYAQQVLEAIQLLDDNGGDVDLPIWIMAETPQGIFNIESIAGSHPRLKTIVMGTSDLAKEMRVRHTPDRIGMLVPLSLCVMAARVHGLDIIDGVYLDLENAAGFEAACIQGRDMGFDGKTLIHPKQITMSNQIFAPNEAEVQHAKKVIQAWDEARQAGKGVVVVDGRLIENLHVEEAKRLLVLYQTIQNRTTG